MLMKMNIFGTVINVLLMRNLLKRGEEGGGA
jgi:hypothetical protein